MLFLWSYYQYEDVDNFIDAGEEKLIRTQWKLIRLPNRVRSETEMTLNYVIAEVENIFCDMYERKPG